MTRRGQFELRCLSRAAIVAAIAFAGPFFAASMIGIRINLSPSLPLGLYRKTSELRVGLAEFCPEEPYARFAIARGYRSNGNCPDGASPLMKPIVANIGDVVAVSTRGITVNGVLQPNTAPKVYDSKGRPMHPWPAGEYRVQADSVWVASSYNPWSYDSRYFGPVPRVLIRGRLKPFLTLGGR
jgi:conjugative transfer signal peptidase TraF